MIAATLSAFWRLPERAQSDTAPPKPPAAPVFIGDAVMPFAGETLLLSLLRAQALRDIGRNG
jgi:hypothetical protein